MKKFLRGFIYAITGIKVAIWEERNFRFHICAAIYVYIFSLFYNFSKTEFLVLTLLIGNVLALEIVNSAIERIVGPKCAEKTCKVEADIKDLAAGAVLVLALVALVFAIVLFWNKEILAHIITFFIEYPLLLFLLILSLVGSYFFIFHFGKKKL